MKNAICFCFLIGIFLLAGCQTKPTKVFETKQNRQKDSQKTINEKTVIIDARPAFLSSLARPSGSIPMQWEDFNQQEAPFEGYLATDLFFHARRLARLGITPDSDVWVVGRGPTGDGEEGRLAWTLKRMGVKNVRFSAIEAIDWPLTRDAAPEKPESPVWKPNEDKSLEIKRLEALDLLKKKNSNAWVLDVRPGNEYLKDSDIFPKLQMHSVRLINVPWTEFFNAKGEVNPNVKERLAQVGLKGGEEILVLDGMGVRSAGVTLALRDLGFPKSTNWTGGYRELRWFLRTGR